MTTTPPPDLAQVLACPTLPSLPAVGLQVLELMRKADASVEQIARLVEKDPALSAKVLKTVNSSLYALKDPCTTIRRALGYLGMAAVKSLVLGFSLLDAGRGVPAGAGTPASEYWKRAIFAAASARVIAQESRACDPDEAFTAALFQDLGVLAMLATIGEHYSAAVAGDPSNHLAHLDMEQAGLGFTHTQVGEELATRWRLPPAYAQGVRFHHEPDRASPEHRALVRVVSMSATLTTALTAANGAAHLPALLLQARDWFSLDASRVKAMMAKIAPAARELAQLFDKPMGKLPNVQEVMAQASEELLMSQMSTLREAEELRERNRALKAEAETDALTGLSNRKKFEQQFGRLLDDARARGLPLTLIMADGDKFKSVNDTHGHPAGDAVLRELAARLSRAIEGAGTVYRLGGEEFAILMPGKDASAGERQADAARRLIADSPISLAGTGAKAAAMSFTTSFGVAAFEPGRSGTLDSTQALMEAADRALYEAKHAGRNRVHVERSGAPAGGDEVAAASPVSSGVISTDEPKPLAPRRTHVLLVEDDPLAAKLLSTLFRKAGSVEVEWLRDGETACRRFEELAAARCRPDVVLTDLNLPGMDGLAVLRAVRASAFLSGTPVLVMTATVNDAVSAACQQSGATALLSKSDLAMNLQEWAKRIVAGQVVAPVAARAA